MSLPNREALFINEASGSVGIGHVARDATLAGHLLNLGYKVSFLCRVEVGERDRVLHHIDRAGVELARLTFVEGWNEVLSAASSVPPCVVVVDASASDRTEVVARFSERGHPVVVLDYYASQALHGASAIINLLRTHEAQPPASPGRLYAGGDYAVIRPDVLEARWHRRPMEAAVGRMLVSFGGADPGHHTKPAIHLAKGLAPRAHVDVVVGPLVAASELRAIEQSAGECLTIHRSVPSLAPFLQRADLVFCGGGGTLLEALCVGAPAVVMPQSAAEKAHAAQYAEAGACTIHGHVDLTNLRDLSLRQSLSHNGRRVIDGRGAERICDLIERLAGVSG